jgi:hypothetical protein
MEDGWIPIEELPYTVNTLARTRSQAIYPDAVGKTYANCIRDFKT